MYRWFLSINRRIAVFFLRLGQALFLRLEVEGQENIPDDGPLLILFNHLSNFDAPLVMANFPHELEAVGPGDFKLLPIQLALLKLYGMSLIKRGSPDRSTLKVLLDHLKAGRMLGMAPDGGTWEKPITDIKPGAAYLSQATGTPILPGVLAGMYGLGGKVFRLERPRVKIIFGEVMPPVPRSKDRRQREADLDPASQQIAAAMYDLLPEEDQARYDRWAAEVYTLDIDYRREEDGKPVTYSGPSLPEMAALAEFIGKPNLFRPMWQNAYLPVEVFMERRYFHPMEVKISARLLRDTLTDGDFANYLPYRLGDAKSAQALAALDGLMTACDWALDAGAKMRLKPRSTVQDVE